MTKKPKAFKKKKMSKRPKASPPPLPLHLPSSPSFSTLPDEVVVSILARISKSDYNSLCLVSKSFYSLLSSPDIYTVRSEIGATESRLYLYLRLPKPEKNRWFSLFDKVSGGLGLAPVRLSYSDSPARSHSTYVAVGSEIYQIGGRKYSKAVRVLDCRSHTWRLAPPLTVGRKNAKSCFLDGKIYLIGGRREDDSMIWGEIFDIKTQIWKPMRSPEDDNSIDLNLQVVVLEGRVNLVTKGKKYVYDTEQGRWIRDLEFVDILNVINRPFCVIDNVIFARIDGRYKWFDSMNGKWSVLENLDYVWESSYGYDTIQLVNHGGKLVIIWRYWRSDDHWCVVIRLEKRLTPLGTQYFWGEVEHNGNLGSFPKSYNILSCLSIYL